MEDVKLFQCKWNTCTATFISYEEFITHFRKEHEQKLLMLRQQRINHLKGIKENVFQCQWKGQYSHLPCSTSQLPCLRTFNRMDNFKVHIRSHTGDKPYICEVPGCKKSFASASDRLKHENRTHSKVKAYKCSWEDCSKSYTDPSSLRKHFIRSHGLDEYERCKQMKQALSEEDYQKDSPMEVICYEWKEVFDEHTEIEKPGGFENTTLPGEPTLANSHHCIPGVLIPMQSLHEYYDGSQYSPQTVVDKFAPNIYQVAPISTNPAVKVEDFIDLEMARDIENYLAYIKSKPGYDYHRN